LRKEKGKPEESKRKGNDWLQAATDGNNTSNQPNAVAFKTKQKKKYKKQKVGKGRLAHGSKSQGKTVNCVNRTLKEPTVKTAPWEDERKEKHRDPCYKGVFDERCCGGTMQG